MDFRRFFDTLKRPEVLQLDLEMLFMGTVFGSVSTRNLFHSLLNRVMFLKAGDPLGLTRHAYFDETL